jgi:cytochrome c553
MRHPFHRHLYRPLPTFAPLVMCIVVFATLPSQFSVMADEASAQPSNGIEEKNDGESLKISDEQAEFFQTKVLPLLESRCFECHGDQDDVEAELRLTSRKAMLTGGESGAAIVPSDPDSSLIIQAMRYEGFQMPPRSKMPDAEIDIFVKWIKDGAPWPAEMESKTAVAVKTQFPMDERIASHWAWKKIQRPDVPTTKNSSWPISDVDRFLLVALENAGISPAGDADRRVLLRRLYFDLLGLPPTVEQQDRFFQDPAETSMAMEKVVDELLASPQFGERWARHWLDLMRYAETLGHEFDYPLPHAWRYRDYVIRAFNNDVPYDQFVREHIAGDLLTQPRRHPQAGFNESIIATGFWYLCEDKHAPVDVKAEEASRIDNQIDVFGKTFLGLTIACARCHDHKFDAITAEDYYALSGFLQSSRRRVEWIDSHGETDKLIAALQTHRVAAEKQLYTGLEEFRKAEQASLITDASGLKPSIEESPASSADERDVDKDKTTRLAQILADPQTKDLSHPLSLWATIKQKADNQTLSEVVESWTAIRDLARQKNEELIAKRDP